MSTPYSNKITSKLRLALSLIILKMISRRSFNAIGRLIRVERFPDRDFSDDEKTDVIVNLATYGICEVRPSVNLPDEVIEIITEYSIKPEIVELAKLRNSALEESEYLMSLGEPSHTSNSIVKNLNSSLWSLMRVLRRVSSFDRDARRSIEVKKAPKFDFSAGDITQAITLISVGLVTGGFLYETIFFKRLGIDITRYLSISDYLSASIGTISPAAVALGVNAALVFYEVTDLTKANRATLQARIKSGRLLNWIFRLTVLVGGSIEWVVQKQFPFDILPIAAWLVALAYIPNWSSMYFKKSIFVSFLILFCIFFFVRIYSMAELNAIAVRSGKYFKGDGDHVNLDDTVKNFNQNDQLRLLETTSNFCFLYDTKIHKVWVFPKEKVKAIYGATL